MAGGESVGMDHRNFIMAKHMVVPGRGHGESLPQAKARNLRFIAYQNARTDRFHFACGIA
jgi:hypothetical protein